MNEGIRKKAIAMLLCRICKSRMKENGVRMKVAIANLLCTGCEQTENDIHRLIHLKSLHEDK